MGDPTTSPEPEPEPEPTVGSVDVERLVAERDALRAELEAQRQRRTWGQRIRRIVAPLLVALFALSLLGSGLGVWLQRNTLDEDVWAERVVPLGQDPEVQAALARWASDELLAVLDTRERLREVLPDRTTVLAVPLSSAVDGWVRDRVEVFFASERFETLWAAAATRAHAEARDLLRDRRPNVTADDGTITINLIPLMNAALSDILERAPALIGIDADLPDLSIEDLPAAARDRIGRAIGVDLDDGFGVLVIDDGGQLSLVQRVVRQLDRFVILTTALTVAAAVAALWVSPRRRRTLLQILGAAALVTVVVRRVAFLVHDQVVGLVQVDVDRRAATVVVRTFTDPLTSAGARLLVAIALVVAVVVVTGPYPWAVRSRRGVARGGRAVARALGGRVGDPATAAWVGDHVDGLRLAGYAAGALVLWFVDLTWLRLLLVVGLVAAWQVVVPRAAASAALPDGEAGRP